VKVPLSAPEVMKRVSDVDEDAVTDREVHTRLLVTVTGDDELRVRVAPDEAP
jgi:transcriptional regulator